MMGAMDSAKSGQVQAAEAAKRALTAMVELRQQLAALNAELEYAALLLRLKSGGIPS
jgi:hypothetical protein